MTTLSVTDYLKYANLQLATEALYGFNATPSGANLIPGGTLGSIDNVVPIQAEWLTAGNLHALGYRGTSRSGQASNAPLRRLAA